MIVMVVVVVVIISWAITSFNQTNVSETQLFSLMMSKVTGKIDMVRGFFRNALVLSSHAGTSGVGAMEKSFYCNGPATPSENYIRFSVSESTKQALNSYIDNLDLNDALVELEVSDFECIDTPLYNGLGSGDYDEGFPVESYGSNINVTSRENKIESSNDMFDYISENRFWFLYRKMKVWVENNEDYIFSKNCACLDEIDCESSHACDSGSCPIFGDCLQTAFDQMAFSVQKYIGDEYVRCYGSPSCCYTEKLDTCEPDPSGDCSFSNGGTCFNCNEYADEDLCIDKIVAQDTVEACIGNCRYWETWKANIKGSITCVDKRYQLSIPGTERYLEFKIDIVSSLERNGVNTQDLPCVGEGDDCRCPDKACEGTCEIRDVVPSPGNGGGTGSPGKPGLF
jgi:hypothetical protein